MKHFEIYQVDKSQPLGARIMFRSLDTIQEEGTPLTLDAYKKVYEGDIERKTDSTLPLTEQIYVMFNLSRPKDFKGHSLSVSDIIVIDNQQYFCDDYGFRPISLAVSKTKDEKNTTNNTIGIKDCGIVNL